MVDIWKIMAMIFQSFLLYKDKKLRAALCSTPSGPDQSVLKYDENCPVRSISAPQVPKFDERKTAPRNEYEIQKTLDTLVIFNGTRAAIRVTVHGTRSTAGSVWSIAAYALYRRNNISTEVQPCATVKTYTVSESLLVHLEFLTRRRLIANWRSCPFGL